MEININKREEEKFSVPIEPIGNDSGTTLAPESSATPARKSSDHLYLERLEFNPELRKSWLNFFIVNFRVVLLLIVLLTALGVYAYKNLPRESSPEVKIPMAVVMTAYPGASPTDVEELVTKKIETGIAGVKDVKQITSSSANSFSAVTVEFDAKADLDDSIRKLRDAVSNAKNDLPADAQDPSVVEISIDDTPIWTISLIGPYDGFTMREAGEDIKAELEKIPGIREVKISGGDEKEFSVSYDPQKLASYNLSPATVNQIILGQNLAIPAGNFTGEKYVYPIRVDGRFFTAADLANLPIFHTAEGAVLTLKDVAEVKETAIKKTVYSRLSSGGQESRDDVTLQIIKKTGGNIVETVKAARTTTDQMLTGLPAGIEYAVTIDMADEINKEFDQLTHDFILTLIMVFVILFLIVGLKEALVAGLAIPLVFFATFGAMLASGISLNFLSVFSLILALGLLVDDAIVVVSATKQYLRTGKFTPEEAVLLVLNDFKVVLTTTTLTTVWAFLPLLLATGIIGEFIKSIPITVSVTLVASLAIALIINHPLAAVLERVRLTKKLFTVFLLVLIFLAVISLLGATSSVIAAVFAVLFLSLIIVLAVWYFKKGRPSLEANGELQDREWQSDALIKKKLREQGSHENGSFLNRLLHGVIHFNAILPYYEKYLRRILATKKTRRRTLGVVTILFIIAIALPASGIVQSEFFPASDYDLIYINATAPTGLRLEESDQITRRIEERLRKYPQIDNFSTLVGQGASADSFISGGSSSHQSSITVKLVPAKERDIKAYDLADRIRADLADIKDATITVESPSGGPPAGSAFEARISGDDLQVLDKIAKDLEKYLEPISGVISTDISLKESPADYTFTLDSNRLELYSLNAASVGSVLRLAISGTEVTTVLRDGQEIKVMARFAADKIPDLEAIGNLQVLNLTGQPVFLKDVANIELKPSVEAITRVDQKRAVVLSAGVQAEANPTLVLKQFQKDIKGYQLPSGYEIYYGGENEQNTESVMSIIQAMAVAGILIISTLIIQFNSVKKAAIVLVTIPLALIGVFFGLAIARINLSFPGLIGILALFGIVVKNAIILVDKISLNLKSGIGFKDSVIDAGKARLEAIFITSICTIIGIIPITLSNEMWRALGGAIIFGLMLSSFLTLFIVPTLFMTFIKEEKKFRPEELLEE